MHVGYLSKIAWIVCLPLNQVAQVLIQMSIKFQVDRHFLFLHGHNLAVFADRVLRKSRNSTYIPYRETLGVSLESCNAALRDILENSALKRKERTEAVREKEGQVLLALSKMAEYVEQTASCKSDVFTTGFRPHSEHQKLKKDGVETRRRQRVSAKLAQLEDDN